jgi:hypothetical protein
MSAPEAQGAFWALKSLFMRKERLGRWDGAFHAIPATREDVLRVASCCSVYGHTAGSEPITAARFRLDVVVGVMLEIPDPKAYCDYVMRGELKKVSAVFHPNTFKATQQRLRGSLGELAEMNNRHADHLGNKMKVTRA